MRIESQQPEVLTLQQKRRSQDKNIQNVFSEVLREAGRQGYATAEVTESNEPLQERVQASWNQWYQIERMGGRFATAESPQDLGESFGRILTKAYEQGAYVAPTSFLKGLSEAELKSVQNSHWLAEPIDVDSLTEEGALNLLLPQAAQVDLNGDGFTRSGVAYGMKFPDSSTSREVTQAWDAATADMPERDRMIYELQMMAPVLFANLTVAPDGTVSQRDFDDPDWVNPLTADGYSFLKETQSRIDSLDYFKNQMDPTRYATDRHFWSSFQDNLRQAGAN
ncbi:hypothetical protein Q31b_37980 [Novipirellula aureliae]|uniref:Uncharacterized protein n=1 Tax=Novipirellula aureliae TaxID=2527966 RepID=A0A5C6DPI6_9BACT|nr:hypothetical protein [Novipirellula aureliae]TWU38720.1 hypothetical protein Q31b_37980 [Novipirellula aureliae]